MSYEDISNIVGGVLLCNRNTNLFGNFILDSRNIKKGDCFIAINGGVNYIEDAINKGAQLIISETDYNDEEIDKIKVTDINKTLINLAHSIREKYSNIPIIAVTGSVGKTTTKELIASILETKYSVLKSSGNNNNNIGIPLTMFKLNNNYNICVLEFGMNHFGEIDELSRCVNPNDAVITNIGTSHIGYLESKKNIFKAKKEIMNGLKKGILFINGDDKYLRKIKYNNIVRVGLNSKNSLYAYNIITTKEKLYFNINIDNRRYNVVFNIPNKLLITNILLAIAVGLKYNIPINLILKQVRNYKSLNHRNNILKLNNGIIVIDDCYNSCHESLIGGLDLVHKYEQEKILIIGDILELGRYSKKIHKKIGNILSNECGTIILVGEEIKYAKKSNFLLFKNCGEVIDYLGGIKLDNKLIYLKASHDIKLEKIKTYLEDIYNKK